MTRSRSACHASRIAALALATGLFCASAAAQLKDPTRPPADYAIGDAAAADSGGGLSLQSVIISPTQKAAIINGIVVKLGEKYGNAVLVHVAESEVVLKDGNARQVLRLHPGVDKRAAAGARGAGGSRSGSDTTAGTAGGAQPQ